VSPTSDLLLTGYSLAAAREYVGRGWRIVPIQHGEKRPAMPGWPDFKAELENVPRLFSHGENIGLILGPKSGDIIDIDLDCTEAIALADLYLPASKAEFGRASKPRSHRFFIAPAATFEAFPDPIAKDTLLELRTDGRDGGAHLTLLPPSITDNEQRQWHGDVIAPAAVEASTLRRRCAYLAIGCLIARYVSQRAAERPGPDLARLLWEFDHELARPAYRWLGRPAPDAPQRHPRPRHQLSRRDPDLAEIVHAIRNEVDWNGWNAIGMAIFVASGGSADGFIVFDDFSAKSSRYQPHAVEERWRNYRRSPPTRIGMGSLVHMARQCGWSPKAER
jgi:hypothetical protein